MMQLPYSNTVVQHWNPGATMPLILPVHLVCNVPDELIYANVRVNSRRPGKWLQQSPAHGRVAVLCGSGPSLGDHLDDVRAHQESGAAIFAMNGAARFLDANGILPDYQVLIDARPQTAELVGPAKEHLFASQVHPDCFERAPNATVWHLQDGSDPARMPIDDHLPPYEGDYCLIGGAASVGNTAAALAYAMGYRTLHLYGYDSSHRAGKGHAFSQPMNDTEPTCFVTWHGTEYLCSLTMKSQAERFLRIGRALVDAGCSVTVHGDGLLPALWNTPVENLSEQDKYTRMWLHDEYRAYSPGEALLDMALEALGSPARGKFVDFGCGTGRAAKRLAERGYEVLAIDFAANCLDPDVVRALPFRVADLAELPADITGDYGLCCDVMEHLPHHQVHIVLGNIRRAVRGPVFFSIASEPDACGALIGARLHLTVEPADWWHQQIAQHWQTVRCLGGGAFAANPNEEPR